MYSIKYTVPGSGTSRHERERSTSVRHWQQSVHIDLHVRVHCQTDGVVQGFFPVRLEHFRPNHRVRQSGGYHFRTGGRTECVARP